MQHDPFIESQLASRVWEEQEEAKKEYDEATKAGKQAQLLSEERPDVFSITADTPNPESSTLSIYPKLVCVVCKV